MTYTYTIRPLGELVLTALATANGEVSGIDDPCLVPKHVDVQIDETELGAHFSQEVRDAIDAAARGGYFSSCVAFQKGPRSASEVAAAVGEKLNSLLGYTRPSTPGNRFEPSE